MIGFRTYPFSLKHFYRTHKLGCGFLLPSFGILKGVVILRNKFACLPRRPATDMLITYDLNSKGRMRDTIFVLTNAEPNELHCKVISKVHTV